MGISEPARRHGMGGVHAGLLLVRCPGCQRPTCSRSTMVNTAADYFTQSIPVRGSAWDKPVGGGGNVVAMVLTLARLARVVGGGRERRLHPPDAGGHRFGRGPTPRRPADRGAVLVPVWVMTSVYYSRVAHRMVGVLKWWPDRCCRPYAYPDPVPLAMVVIPFGLGIEGERVAVVPFNPPEEMPRPAAPAMPLGFAVTAPAGRAALAHGPP